MLLKRRTTYAHSPKPGGSKPHHPITHVYIKRLENLIIRLDCTLSDLDAERATGNLERDMPVLRKEADRSDRAGFARSASRIDINTYRPRAALFLLERCGRFSVSGVWRTTISIS